MGRIYSAWGDQTPGADASIIGITSAATIRPEIIDIDVSSGGVPEDKASKFVLQRYTVAGTATAFTPIANDPGDPAALAASGYNHTVEPTYTANALLWVFGLNQRGFRRWVATPHGGFKLPATAANGAGLKFSTTTATVDHLATIRWEE